MEVTSYVLSSVALLAGAAVYGADLFAAIVLRPALSHLDTAELTRTMGFVHRYGDRRMPFLFAVSVIAGALAAGAALSAGREAAGATMGVVVLTRLVWLVVYVRVSAPINRELTSAAMVGHTLPNAHAMQRRWDSVVPVRLGLDTLAIAGGCLALALP